MIATAPSTKRKRKSRKAPPPDIGWQYVVDNWKQLHVLCARLGRKFRPDLIDELFSDVIVIRVPDLVRRYDPNHPSGTPLKVWVEMSVRRYISKWFKARGIHEQRHEPIIPQITAPETVPSFVEADSVEAVLKLLSRRDRRILRMRFIHGYSLKKIAERTGSHRSSVCEEVQGAIVRARQAAMGAALQRSIAYRARRSTRECDTTTSPIASERATTGIGNGSTIRGPSC